MAVFSKSKNYGSKYSQLKHAEELAEKVLVKYKEFDDYTNEDFKNKTNQLIDLLSKGKTLDDIIVEAYSLVTQVIKRVTTFEMHKVQIMAGVVINHGDIAELKTGEGKTLSATLPAYLNALNGKGVLIVTVNEYLARRDASEMSEIYSILGLETGVVLKDQSPLEKKEQYLKDIIYITNAELGFDYLRDNMVKKMSHKTQRGMNFAIIDEADSILIDEARTPLIISGKNTDPNHLLDRANTLVMTFDNDDYDYDKETKLISLNTSGAKKVEAFFKVNNLYNSDNSELVHRIQNALHANFVLSKDVDYAINKESKVEIIDTFTGRILQGRSYSNGLHQAVEIKENAKRTEETIIHSTITYQNLFRLFSKLSGMTGTAETEEEEFLKVFNMKVLAIPTNLPIIRSDLPDSYFGTKREKWKSIINHIKEVHELEQPLLVGTRSVEDSEFLYKKLLENGLHPEILNAKNNDREAEIVQKAGQKNSITISTNMAGRGTDIKLGEGVIDLGGLYVIGTERHESRRIDNQLRGRAGRQGDPGVSKFFVSLQDEIMIRTGLGGKQKSFEKFGVDGVSSKTLTKAITSSQKRIEGMNFDSRKNLIEYDDVINQQREIIYKQRDLFMLTEDATSISKLIIKRVAKELLYLPVFRDKNGDIMYEKISNTISKAFFQNNEWCSLSEINALEADDIVEMLEVALSKRFDEIYLEIEDDKLSDFLRKVYLDIVDANWQKHIDQIEKLKSGVKFRQYAQQNPLQTYIKEANLLFDSLKERINHNILKIVMNTNVNRTSSKRISE